MPWKNCFCCHELCKRYGKRFKKARPERVFITHSGCEQETVEKVRAYLKELDIFDEILETRAGGVVSSHCGPGTLSVLYIAK
ncbi:MAG: DegV family protein [Ruminococcus sp.]